MPWYNNIIYVRYKIPLIVYIDVSIYNFVFFLMVNNNMQLNEKNKMLFLWKEKFFFLIIHLHFRDPLMIIVHLSESWISVLWYALIKFQFYILFNTFAKKNILFFHTNLSSIDMIQRHTYHITMFQNHR